MRKLVRNISLCLMVMSLLATDSLWAGTVTGQVELKSIQSRRSNPRYGGADSALLGPPSPFVGVVYLTQDTPIDYTAPEQPYQLSQKGLQFYPSVLPISVGSKVKFPNEDNTYHNVFSYSPEKRFDLGRYAKDATPPEIVFDEAGQIRLFCEVHEHMRAVILVLETPYFVTTDETGQFELRDVPPGDYTLHIWQVSRPLHSQQITVGDAPVVIE